MEDYSTTKLLRFRYNSIKNSFLLRMPVRIITPSRAGFIIATAAFVSAINIVIYGGPNYSNAYSFGPKSDDLMLERFLSGPLEQDDPTLIQWVNQMFVPPSTNEYMLDYVLSGLHQEQTLGKQDVYSPSQEFILGKVEELLGQSIYETGTFLEAGAYDGEFLSNTLSLELNFGWRGILVEAHPKYFQKLLTKNRKAWAINVCLNIKPWPSKEIFSETSAGNDISNHILNGGRNEIVEKNTNKASSGLHRYVELDNKTDIDSKFEVQCLPIYTIIKSLGMSHIDFLSLDVEGAEMEILDTIPWDKLSFSIMAIEHKTLDDIREYLRPKGYIHVESLGIDHIFVDKNVVVTGVKNPAPSQEVGNKTNGNDQGHGSYNHKEIIKQGLPPERRLFKEKKNNKGKS